MKGCVSDAGIWTPDAGELVISNLEHGGVEHCTLGIQAGDWNNFCFVLCIRCQIGVAFTPSILINSV